MKPIDTHAHLVPTIRYGTEDLKNVIESSLKYLSYIFNIGINLKTCKEILELNKYYPNILPILGIHPTDSNNFSMSTINELEKLIKNNKQVIAIGETGLDYYHKNVKENQKKSFIEHIKLAIKYNLPVIIHSRESHDDIYEIIRNYPNVKFLLHSWGGTEEQTKKFLDNKNIYFSFSGILTFKNAQIVRDIFNIIPKDRIMFETDAPWLSPEPKRGKINYPKYVIYVIRYAAELMNISYEELVKLSNKNIMKFFNLNLKDES